MSFIKYSCAGQVCEFEVPQTGVLFGRSQSADFELQDSAVSRKHFSISKNQFGKDVLTDHGSHNGTILNNELVRSQERELRDGDEIRLINFCFTYCDKVSANADNSGVAMIGATANTNISDFDDSTVSFTRPAPQAGGTGISFGPAVGTAETATLLMDEVNWARLLKEFAAQKSDANNEFLCTYGDIIKICDSFPAPGEVVAAKLKAKGVLAELGKELIADGCYPNGNPRMAEAIRWKWLA